MEKTRINLDILLPEIPDERDACVQRLISALQQHKGLGEVHLIPKKDSNEAQLCFHYQQEVVSLKDIEKLAKEAGAKISKQYGHLLVEVRAFREINEAIALEKQLGKLKGVEEVSVAATGMIRLEFRKQLITEKQIRAAIKKEGFEIEHDDSACCAHDHVSPATTHNHTHSITHEHDHNHDHSHEGSGWNIYIAIGISLLLLIAGIVMDQLIHPSFFTGWIRLVWYVAAYLPVGFPVAFKGINYLLKGDIFTEFVLMTIATIGAFCIGEYPEGVTVMLFYMIGELFQDLAVNRAKRSIKALLDIRPDKAMVIKEDTAVEVHPENVRIGDILLVKPGEKVPLDGELLTSQASFNAAALTGESHPSVLSKGETALAGMINLDRAIEMKVTKLFKDSSLARILHLVQEATTRKAKTEQFIRTFSRIYTPVVVFLAIGITFIPYFFVNQYVFNDWLYKALIFLVISCPCALVISIPLGYFGGIGAASRNGILFKGSNFLDIITKVNTVVMDKTGTLTKGVFRVQQVISYDESDKEWLMVAAALEAQSTHPIAKAIVAYVGEKAKQIKVEHLEEVSGQGLKGVVHGQEVVAGNVKLMESAGLQPDEKMKQTTDTLIAVAIDKKLKGYLTIADEIKADSKDAIHALNKRNIETIMLSGDKQSVVDKVAAELSIKKAHGGLLPENKVEKLRALKEDKSRVIAFVGDGINDAPVLAVSDIGMAMGGLGSDAAIETADVVIQTDQPSKIIQAIEIGKATRNIVWQNIGFAFGVKAVVLVLGAGGMATMWEAVFADVGVALLAILNAVRIQKKKFII